MPAALKDYLPAFDASRTSPPSADPEAVIDGFTSWAQDAGFTLYPAQEEALLEIVSGSHVIMATPTGSGKSMVAAAAHFAALAARTAGDGGVTYYTAPLKALVSEKFFALVKLFGSENVGMMTGDSAVNPEAPIICCTAEILANLALRRGDDPKGRERIAQVVMDEFHFYADPQRGWAWQVPLLTLTSTQFILMSATLGDTSFFEEDLQQRTGRPIATVTSTTRPVPLSFEYVVEPITEVIEELVHTHRTPVYVVHFAQKDAIDRATALLSTKLISAEQKKQIVDELGDFRFARGFGSTLSKLLRAGIGIHHAGMLPKYRRVVERLTQLGLLAVVCGTDTLGVGINVPIRTVLITSLVKFDGVKMRHVTAREFHQIAGRAGRAGYDTLGEVLVMAPEHVIENRKALQKAGDDPKKLRKIVRKKAPEGSVNWTDKTFERLRDADPEPLTSNFAINHAMVLNVLGRTRADFRADPVAILAHLLTANHDAAAAKREHVRRALQIYRSLKQTGLIEHSTYRDAKGLHARVTLTRDLPDHFALNQPLSPFALAAQELLDIEAPTHSLDVISTIEATLDDPRQVLYAQQRAAKGEAIAAMKAEGYDYDERMAALEEIKWPRPLADVLEPAFATYRRTNPWVADAELACKSVVREMVETGATFGEYVGRYSLDRTEGVLLRYLADAYRALSKTVAPEHRTEHLADIVVWLGEMIASVDSSLLDEWERLSHPVDDDADTLTGDGPLSGTGESAPVRPLTANARSFRIMVAGAMFRRVELAARENYSALGALDSGDGWHARAWADALDPLFDEFGDDAIGIDGAARSAALVHIDTGDSPGARTWRVRQVIDDPDHTGDWSIVAEVDLDASDEAGQVVLHILSVGPWEESRG
ncbi:DEAD/DEAH box helicase [Rarobacter faecitabidus]|uniref:Helicase-like protein n=1 Tax=Rarobacter faecitabidus TaxID=13243 RepID=A0A542ZWU9_RARFA|nr:DEAD/DEAH box helicase [Rarobacter faecitabidus]TQL64834.1 helicase-like protein [Rarobacter faecitabidus]